MKKLFKVTNPNGLVRYFNYKSTAKLYRDTLRQHGMSAHVKRGPDHWRGETF